MSSLWTIVWVDTRKQDSWSSVRDSKEDAWQLVVSMWESELSAKVDRGEELTEEENRRGSIVANLPLYDQYQLVRRYEEQDLGIIIRLVEVRPSGQGQSNSLGAAGNSGRGELTAGDQGRDDREVAAVLGASVGLQDHGNVVCVGQ